MAKEGYSLHVLAGCVRVFFFFHLKSRWLNKPEGFVHRAVPTDKGARSEEEGPEDGEAQADATGRGRDTEHGEGGDQVQEQRAGVD